MTPTLERRRGARCQLPGVVRGSVSLRTHVQVINLSPNGAMIEHLDRLFPGFTCVLFVHLAGEDLRVASEVMWSQVFRVQTLSGKTGEGQVVYRSGLRFPNIPERTEALVRNFLATLPPPGAPLPP